MSKVRKLVGKYKISKAEDVAVYVETRESLTLPPIDPKPVTSDPLLWWKAGDIVSRDYEEHIRTDTRNVDQKNRKTKKSQFKYRFPNGRFGANINTVLPYFDEISGNMKAVRSVKTAAKHVMFKCSLPGKLVSSSYLKLDTTYRIAFSIAPINYNTWLTDGGFVIAHQCWGPAYPSGSLWSNPPLFVRWYQGEWQCGVKGGKPNKKAKFEKKFSAPFENKWSTFDILYRPSYTNGRFSVLKDGKLLGEIKNKVTTVVQTKEPHRGPLPVFGAYTWNKPNPGVGFEYSSVLIEEIE